MKRQNKLYFPYHNSWKTIKQIEHQPRAIQAVVKIFKLQELCMIKNKGHGGGTNNLILVFCMDKYKDPGA